METSLLWSFAGPVIAVCLVSRPELYLRLQAANKYVTHSLTLTD